MMSLPVRQDLSPVLKCWHSAMLKGRFSAADVRQLLCRGAESRCWRSDGRIQYQLLLGRKSIGARSLLPGFYARHVNTFAPISRIACPDNGPAAACMDGNMRSPRHHARARLVKGTDTGNQDSSPTTNQVRMPYIWSVGLYEELILLTRRLHPKVRLA